MKKIGTVYGPAGVGKDTLLRGLLPRGGYGRIVNDTTRQPRPGEVNGSDYYFISMEEYGVIKSLGGYATSTYANGRYYGVRRKEIQKSWEEGLMPIGHFGTDDHVDLWDNPAYPKVASVMVVTKDYQTWKDRMQQRVDSGFISRDEMILRGHHAVQELRFGMEHIDRFAIVRSLPGSSSVDEADLFFKKGIKPAIDRGILEETAEGIERFLIAHGETNV